ncbi:MAG: hypothetical protein LBK71_02550 [Verrucomicrobiales bacterium]|jgi:hypothetical protein|nr:hypothetical protein [Verrucomicrobiales bacterium]
MPVITIRLPRLRLPRLSYGVLGVSVALHAGLLLVSGWIVIRPAAAPRTPAAFTVAAPEFRDEWDAPAPEPEDLAAPAPSADDESAPAPPLPFLPDHGARAGGELVASVSAAVPAMIGAIGGLLPDSGAAAGGPGSTGSGDRVGKGLAGKITVGNIFNTRVESAKLGVLLDVSSSAHPYLPVTVSEIERSFGDAVIVLAYGCGMYDTAADDGIYLRALSRCQLPAAGDKNTLGQIAKAAAADGDLGRLIKKFRARRDTHVLYAGDCGHTYYGFKKLIAEQVDTVYWFADFRDKISARVAGKLIKELQARGVKVIAHNFTGKPVPAAGAQIAAATGGATIAKIPGGKKP